MSEVTYTRHPTEEVCWLHSKIPLWWIEMSNGTTGLYCYECGGPTHPACTLDLEEAWARRRRRRRNGG